MSDSNLVEMLFLPKTMEHWAWKRNINPHHEEVSAQSDAWFHGFKAFNERSQHAFNKCDFGLLAALAYPWASKEHLRAGCDLMNLFFVIDEYTDVEDASVVREMVDVVIDAVKDPHKPRPENEIILGEVARQFWELATKTASPSSQRYFLESFTSYLNSVVDQATDRDGCTINTIDDYLNVRRENVGARPSYVIGALGLDLPHEVFYHPAIVELSYYSTDLIIVDNDIASYNKEQATGDDRLNILTIAMRQFNIDLEGAMTWAAKYHSETEAQFMEGLKNIPSFDPVVDKQVEEYILFLANWVRANECWNFEGGRYFGNKGLEVQKSRYVPRLPKLNISPALKREHVQIIEP